MKKIYYLSTCDTCRRIMKEVGVDETFEKQDIKNEAITADQLEGMKQLAGTYESLFSRVARKYKELGLKDKNLTEDDYKHHILEDYTFLKRPVFVINDQIFIGNNRQVVEKLKARLLALISLD